MVPSILLGAILGVLAAWAQHRFREAPPSR